VGKIAAAPWFPLSCGPEREREGEDVAGLAHEQRGGATLPLPKDGGAEKLRGDLKVGPRFNIYTRILR